MQLYAQHNFTVVRQIADHTDVSTYYVRAVIRNAYTDEILKTLNLTDKGGQRFKENWEVPADPSGEGFFISIVTSVYTDSGYTTKSDAYGDEENTYQVIDQPRVVGGGGGGGGGLAGRDVRDIFQEEFAKVVDKLKPEKQTEVEPIDTVEEKDYGPDFQKILDAIKALKSSIKEPQKISLTPIEKGMKALKKSVDDIEIPKLDLSPVLNALKDGGENNELNAQEMKSILNDFMGSLGDTVSKALLKILKDANFVTSSVTFLGGKKLPAIHKNNMPIDEAPPKQSEPDISKLTS